MIKKLAMTVLICTVMLSEAHGWYGRAYDTHRYCRGYRAAQVRGYSKYGFPRAGGILDGKPFYWYGTQRIWWNDSTPYVYHEHTWQKWVDVFPCFDQPKKL